MSSELDAKAAAAVASADDAADKVVVDPTPILPRTKAKTVSPDAVEQAVASASESPAKDTAASSESPANAAPSTTEPAEKPAPDEAGEAEPRAKRKTVDPATLRETKAAADLISLPRTMSEEWMAADADDGAYEPETQRRWLVPAIVAGIAAVGLIVIVAVTGGDDDTPRSTVAARQEPVGSAPAPALPAAQIDAAVLVPETVPADAADITDANEMAATPVDAAAVAVVSIDAAVDAASRVAVVPIDAAVPVNAKPTASSAPEPAAKPVPATKPAPEPLAKPVPATKPAPAPTATKPAPKPAVATPKPPAPPADERTIEQLVEAGEFAKANKACATNTIFSPPRLVACATAACNTHSDALAARWIRAIPKASREDMIAKCKALGVDVAVP